MQSTALQLREKLLQIRTRIHAGTVTPADRETLLDACHRFDALTFWLEPLDVACTRLRQPGYTVYLTLHCPAVGDVFDVGSSCCAGVSSIDIDFRQARPRSMNVANYKTVRFTLRHMVETKLYVVVVDANGYVVVTGHVNADMPVVAATVIQFLPGELTYSLNSAGARPMKISKLGPDYSQSALRAALDAEPSRVKCGQIFPGLDIDGNHTHDVQCKNDAVYVLDTDQHVCASCKLDLDREGGLGDLYREIRRLDGKAPELARYKHFRKPGSVYEFVGEGRTAFVGEDCKAWDDVICVVYRDVVDSKVWIRPLNVFYESVTWPDGVRRPRFVLEADVKLEWYVGAAL